MNTHSLNHKLKTALTRRTREQGFAMPVALGLGLVMALVGITVIVRSQGDRVASSAQKATTGGLSAAETGIARYQSLINANRPISMYPACITWSSGSSCSDTGAVTSWGNSVTIPAYSSTCTTSSGGSGTSVISSKATRDWQDIDSTDSTKGQYRLIDYTYTGTPGLPGGTGTLTVEGRVNQSGSGTAATKSAGTSTTRLQVTIPVQKNNRSSPIPGLWVTDNTTATNMSQQKVMGNIVINGCQNTTQINSANIAPLTGTSTPSGSVYATKEMDMPTPPPRPVRIDPVTNISTYTDISADGATAYSSSNPTGIWNTTLPRPSDTKSADGRYYYIVDKLTNPGGSASLTVNSDPTVQVIILVRGPIDLGGGPTVNSPGYPSKLQIYGNTYNNPTSPTIANTKYGCGGLSLTASPAVCPTLSLSINGNGGISALILAPDAVGAVSGGGGGGTCNNVNPPTNNPPSGNFVGAVWIKGYTNASNSNATVICAYGNFTDYVATAAAAQTPWAGIPFTNGWQRVEATP